METAAIPARGTKLFESLGKLLQMLASVCWSLVSTALPTSQLLFFTMRRLQFTREQQLLSDESFSSPTAAAAMTHVGTGF